MLVDLANIAQNYQNWVRTVIATYSAAPSLGFVLGMLDSVGSFESVDVAGARESTAVAPFVFRRVETSPEAIFSDGFSPKDDGKDLLAHALDSGTPPSGYVSTSVSA